MLLLQKLRKFLYRYNSICLLPLCLSDLSESPVFSLTHLMHFLIHTGLLPHIWFCMASVFLGILLLYHFLWFVLVPQGPLGPATDLLLLLLFTLGLLYCGYWTGRHFCIQIRSLIVARNIRNVMIVAVHLIFFSTILYKFLTACQSWSNWVTIYNLDWTCLDDIGWDAKG